MLARTSSSILSCLALQALACAADRTALEQRSTNSSTTGGGSPEAGADAPVCAYAQIICSGSTAKVCDGHGGFLTPEVPCNECKDGLGCVNCVPNAGVCSKETGLATVCDSAG